MRARRCAPARACSSDRRCGGSSARPRRGVRVRTARGVVEARQVVIATGYATRQFRPLAGRFQLSTPTCRDTAARRAGAPRARPRRRDAVGHAAAVPLRALDRRPSAAARRRRSRRSAAAAPAPARLAAAIAGIRAHFERAPAGARATSPIAHAWEGRFAEHAGQPALRRPAPPVSGPRLRARLRRQRHDVRLAGRPAAGRAVAGPTTSRSRAVRLRSADAGGPARLLAARRPVEQPIERPGVDHARRSARRPGARGRGRCRRSATGSPRARRCRARTGSRRHRLARQRRSRDPGATDRRRSRWPRRSPRPPRRPAASRRRRRAASRTCGRAGGRARGRPARVTAASIRAV